MSSHTLIQLWSLSSLLWPTKDYGWISHIVLMHAHHISDVIGICGCRKRCCGGSLFVPAAPFSPSATFCGQRLGEGEWSRQLQLYLCPALDSPASGALSLVKKEHPLFSSSPICQDHSFRLVSFWVEAGVCLWRGMITAKKTDEKAKCRWSLISFEESHLLLLFVTPLSHDPISLFVQGLPAVPLTSHFSSLISTLSSSPFYSSLSPLCLIWFPIPTIPSFIIFSHSPLCCRLFSTVWTTHHGPHVNM